MNRGLLLLLVTIIGFAGCARWYDKDEAIRSLKVLNSDLTNMFITADELPEAKALKFIWDQPSAPVPFPKEKFVYDRPYTSFDISKLNGHYRWDTIAEEFVKLAESEGIKIEYFDIGGEEVSLMIHEFLSVPISSRPDFPTKANAELQIDGNVQTTLVHDASIADELPLKLQNKIAGTNYEINTFFDRTRNGDEGTLEAVLTMIYEDSEVINFRLNATIGYSSLGYYFEKISFSLLLFRHTLSGKIDYDLIDPTADDYLTSFNNNTKIEIFERPMKRKVGNIVLAAVNHGELLDYHIQFRNSETVLLSEYLPVINKILNVKF